MTLKISSVSQKAGDCGISPGDELISINGENIVDLIDYIALCGSDHADLVVKKADGSFSDVSIPKSAGEDIGLDFADAFGITRGCINKCTFCFIDQLPKGMRESLYFKDDDWRMSLIMSNYVTLTNVSDREFDRIIQRRVNPIYISVHATDDDVRAHLIGQERARGIMKKLRRLAENDLGFHSQAVIVPGVNDGKILEKTITDLASLSPSALSLAVVPVGLTKHRENLTHIEPVSREEAGRIIDIVEHYQKLLLKEIGTRFVFAADEMYIKAGRPFPGPEEYEGFNQMGDGVGMAANFRQSFLMAEDFYEEADVNRKASIACGIDIAPFLSEICSRVRRKYGLDISVYPVINRFFGETITVTGLLTGQDIRDQLRGKELGDTLYLSENMFRDKTDVFLDDMSRSELEDELGIKIKIVKGDGYDFLETVLNK